MHRLSLDDGCERVFGCWRFLECDCILSQLKIACLSSRYCFSLFDCAINARLVVLFVLVLLKELDSLSCLLILGVHVVHEGLLVA
jgi:hypothetical protein